MQQQIPDSPALRGLTSAEADARAAQGLTNRQSDPGGNPPARSFAPTP